MREGKGWYIYWFIILPMLIFFFGYMTGYVNTETPEPRIKYVYINHQEPPELIKFYPDSDYMTFLDQFSVTYYCPCKQCCGTYAVGRPKINGKYVVGTASGNWAQEGVTVAVDPSVIPLGTKLYIEGIGVRVAQDTGVKGKAIDVYFNDHNKADPTACSGIHNVWIINENVNLIS